jgi:Pyridoxal-dependent decarboxylase conserved domain
MPYFIKVTLYLIGIRIALKTPTLNFLVFRPVLPSVEPGYIRELLPTEIPEKSESWQEIMQDLDRVIMPGITHWQSPNFHAYYPTQTSYPAIVSEVISAGLGIVGFSWVSSSALNVILLDQIFSSYIFLATDLQSSLHRA